MATSNEQGALGRILVGPAGWSYADWEGIVYPVHKPGGFDPLPYLAQYFDCIEVNSTYYRVPSSTTTAAWVRRTEGCGDFQFTVKLHQSFTHGRDIADLKHEAGAFRDAIEPLRHGNKLGALLLQFPWSFKRTEANATWIKRLVEQFEHYRPVVEVRHASWNTPRVLDWFERHHVGLCAIDQPALKDCIGPEPFRTGSVGYVRFHGRNADKWFEHQKADERYDYLYSEDDLDAWLDRIRAIATGAQTTFVILNNHPRGQAAANGLQLRAALTGAPVPAPQSLRDAFPTLEGDTYAADDSAPPAETGQLFD